MTRLSPRLAGFIAVAVLAAGCGGGTETPEASTPAANASPSSPTTSASPTPSPKPKPWEVKSKAGAEAFGEYWVGALYDMQTSLDSAPFRALGPTCSLCNNFAEQIDKIRKAGGVVRVDRYEVLSSTVQKRQPGTRVGVLVTYHADKVAWTYEKGGEPAVYRDGTVNSLMYLDWAGDHWVVAKLFDIPGE